MNLEVLNHLIKNNVERIEQLAAKGKVDAAGSVGIAKRVLAQKGDVTDLSAKQAFLFETAVRPLIQNVRCEGVVGYIEDGSDTCVSGGIIDDESLLISYLDDDFKCQHCRHDAERMSDA